MDLEGNGGSEASQGRMLEDDGQHTLHYGRRLKNAEYTWGWQNSRETHTHTHRCDRPCFPEMARGLTIFFAFRNSVSSSSFPTSGKRIGRSGKLGDSKHAGRPLSLVLGPPPEVAQKVRTSWPAGPPVQRGQ